MLIDRLVKYKLPNRFVFLDDMPKAGYGKVTKKLFREELEARGSLTDVPARIAVR